MRRCVRQLSSYGAGLNEERLDQVVKIRGVPLLDALHRSLAHASCHVGQIVFPTKDLREDQWRCLKIPPRGSAAHNANPIAEKPPASSGWGAHRGRVAHNRTGIGEDVSELRSLSGALRGDVEEREEASREVPLGTLADASQPLEDALPSLAAGAVASFAGWILDDVFQPYLGMGVRLVLSLVASTLIFFYVRRWLVELRGK